MGLCLRAQSPIIRLDDVTYDEFFSNVVKLNDDAMVNVVSQFHDYSNGIHHAFCNQLIIDMNGSIKTQKVIDSADVHGYNPLLYAFASDNSSIFQFGAAINKYATDFKLIAIKSDSSLNFIKDTVINFNNCLVSVSDAFMDTVSNTIVLSGGISNSYSSRLFLLRFDQNLEVVDSVFFSLLSPELFEFGIHSFSDSLINLLVTSNTFHKDLILRFTSYPFSFKDTLYNRGFGDPYSTYEIKNSFGANVGDSILFTPFDFVEFKDDSLYKHIGIYKWSPEGAILDTLIPFSDTVLSDLVGSKVSLLFCNDTLIMTYCHNTHLFETPDQISSFALLLTDLLGNPISLSSFGSGYRLRAENLFRFNNGNIMVLTSHMDSNMLSWDFSCWLLDKYGNIIQQISIPIPKIPQLKVFPNPSSDFISIIAENVTPIEDGHIVIFSLNGSKVFEKNSIAESGQIVINISNLKSGAYVGNLITKNGKRFHFRFIKN